MKKKKWESLSSQAKNVLGEQFWKDIHGLLPPKGPPVDVYETREKVVVVTELPGVGSTDNITVRLDGDRLLLKGELSYDYPVEEEELISSERFAGSFSRTVELPSPVEREPVRAILEHGLLTVELQKKPESQEEPLEINIYTIPAKGAGYGSH